MRQMRAVSCKSGFETKRKSLEQWMINQIRNGSGTASLPKRFLAFIIDYVISSIVVTMIPMLVTSIITQETAFQPEIFMSMPFIWQIICGGTAIAAGICYFCIYPMRAQNRGQTVGKRIMKIRVADINGGELTYGHLLRRELIGSLLLEGETAFPSAFFKYFLFFLLTDSAVKTLSCVSVTVSLGSVVMGILLRKHRMIHDIIGQTVVVPVHKK